MPALTVNHLQKTFQSKRKAAGLGGSVRSLFRPEYSTVEAVRGLSFEMEPGVQTGVSSAAKAAAASRWQYDRFISAAKTQKF